jgi:hypothetical protein
MAPAHLRGAGQTYFLLQRRRSDEGARASIVPHGHVLEKQQLQTDGLAASGSCQAMTTKAERGERHDTWSNTTAVLETGW